MAHRHEVTDEQWKLVAPFVTKEPARTGRPRRDPREILNGVLWILRTGAPWRDLPERYGPWQTVYGYFNTWRAEGTYDKILEALQIRLDRDGNIAWDLFCIDGSNVRASRAAAGASKKVSVATPKNPQITLWAAREADSAANSTWLLTLKAFPSPLR
jgi:transposase